MSSIFIKTNYRLISGQRGVMRSVPSLVFPKPSNDEDCGVSKDYESIPGMSRFQLFRAFAPGGYKTKFAAASDYIFDFQNHSRKILQHTVRRNVQVRLKD